MDVRREYTVQVLHWRERYPDGGWEELFRREVAIGAVKLRSAESRGLTLPSTADEERERRTRDTQGGTMLPGRDRISRLGPTIAIRLTGGLLQRGGTGKGRGSTII